MAYETWDFGAYGGSGYGEKDLEAFQQQTGIGAYGTQGLYSLAMMAGRQGVPISLGIQERLKAAKPYLSNEDLSRLGFSYIGDYKQPGAKGGYRTIKQWNWTGLPTSTRQAAPTPTVEPEAPVTTTPVAEGPVTTPYSDQIAQLEQGLSQTQAAAPTFNGSAPSGNDAALKALEDLKISSQQQIDALMGTISGLQTQQVEGLKALQEKQAADAARIAETQRTMAINQARSQAAGNLRIEGATTDSGIGGTQAFKIRQQRGVTPYSTLNIPATLNI